jgi:hypothetical protein
VGASVKNDETFRRALIAFSISIKRRYEAVALTQGELTALRQAIPHLMPGLFDALEHPFVDADRIAPQHIVSTKLEAYFRNQTEHGLASRRLRL